MSKSLLQILDEMNQDDIKNGTKLLGVSNEVISADQVKGGTIVKMAAPIETAMELLVGDRMCVLLIIDKKDYARRIEESKK